MTQLNFAEAKIFAREALGLINAGVVEDALRHLLSARLPQMFHENPWWIREHSTGAENHAYFVDTAGRNRRGFIDTLVGRTAIEYEKNLENDAIYQGGYRQVCDYCAALLNRGVSSDDVIGILSDTVRWYAFSVSIDNEPTSGNQYGASNITLHLLDVVKLDDQSDENLRRFEIFINRYMGRQGSRTLNARTITSDLGLESYFCGEHIPDFISTVNSAFSSKERYGSIISDLWRNFVTRYEGEAGNEFSRESYTNELYIMTLAKLLCANILNGEIVSANSGDLEKVLTGQWFKERGFANLVEYDYFGWLGEPPFISDLLSAAEKMQSDLIAYDYKNIMAQDFFGSLMAQLADKDRRMLL